jgi:two-component system, LytTR family, response regulator
MWGRAPKKGSDPPTGSSLAGRLPSQTRARRVTGQPKWLRSLSGPMTQTALIQSSREVALGTLYWLLFLLALEPGNIAEAAANGVTLHWHLEVARILGASMLGGLATPMVMALVRRYPVEVGALWRRVLLHSASAMGIAFALVTLSCILAPIAGIGDTRPFAVALPDHIAANWLPLSFTLIAMVGFAHAVRYQAQVQTHEPESALEEASSPYLKDVVIGSRGHIVSVDLASVRWIETQGNYLALHDGQKTHLLRETLAAFEPKLDPKQFVRIHRRMLVAADRVREIEPLANGDGLVRLADGTELRLSRNHRKRLQEVVRLL